MDWIPLSKNRILAKLPQSEREYICRHAERVNLEPGSVVCEPGRPVHHAYFPVAGVLSCIVTLGDGAVVEAAAIGNDGMAGMALLVDGSASPHRVVQQVPGEMLRLPAATFRAVLAVSAPLLELTNRYTLAIVGQCGQNVACHAHHGVKQRMCRWLLACSDRAGANQFDLTQESLAQMLGVRRQTVCSTAQRLQEAAWISYRRGRLTILDRPALQDAACECYCLCKEAYHRLMGIT
jgi:CRP-like cAMP-binding protein